MNGQYETYPTLHKIVELDTGAQMLGPGEHTYAFSFVVPSDTASGERCVYGRTYHKLVATAPGLGKMGGDLVAEDAILVGKRLASAEEGDQRFPCSQVPVPRLLSALFPILMVTSFCHFFAIRAIVRLPACNHSETGGVPPGFSMERELVHDVLGPVGVNLFSKYLLVAGYLRLGLVLPSINEPVSIDDVKVQLIQTFDLQSLKSPERRERKVVSVLLWNLRGKEAVCTLKAGQEFEILRQFRLPDDDIIRPSTSENAKTVSPSAARGKKACHLHWKQRIAK